MMKFSAALCVLLALLGAVQGQTYTSVQQAVQSRSELSILNTQVSTLSLASQLSNANWVGTVFAPVNSGLQPLQAALGGDLASALGSSAQVNDFFATSVVPGRVLGLADLTNGGTLTTLNGATVSVTVKTVTNGKVYYINKARITTCCIPAGKAVIHEVTPLVVPTEYQSMVDMVAPADTGANTPTVVFVSATPSPSPSPKVSPSPSPKVNASPSPAPGTTTTPSSGSSGDTNTTITGGSASNDTTSGTTTMPSTTTDGSDTTSAGSGDSTTPASTDSSTGAATDTTAASQSSGQSNLVDNGASTIASSPAVTTTDASTTPMPSQYSSAQSSAVAMALVVVPLLVAALL